MIRKLALTFASLAFMATPVVAQGNNTLKPDKDRIVSSIKVTIAAAFCENYAKVSSKVIRAAVLDAANVYGVTTDEAAGMLYDAAEDVWTSTPTSGEAALCMVAHFEVNNRFAELGRK